MNGNTAQEYILACKPGSYLIDNVCVTICPKGYFGDDILGW